MKSKNFIQLFFVIFFISFLVGSEKVQADGEWCCVRDSVDPIACNIININGECNGGNLKKQTCATFTGCPQAKVPAAPVTSCNGKTTGTVCALAGGKTGICLDEECVASATSTDPSTPTSTETTFPNPITSNSLDEVLTTLMSALSGLVVTLAIIFIVIGGILYMVSAGDPGMMKRAKDCWLGAVIGIAIVTIAPTFLKQVQIILGGKLTSGGIENALTIQQIATNVLNFLLSIVGIIAIISLVISGGMYMTAYTDAKQAETAKKIGQWAIIGIIVALGSLLLVQQVQKLITG